MRNIRSVIDSEDFDDMDTVMIFHYLADEMELVSFHDYLKRYIYERAGMKEGFRMIPDKTFQDFIMHSFEENHAPHSFTPTTNKWPAMVKRWLTQDGVRRQVVFLLGFGLRMSAADVSDFLTKVLKEQDFDMADPREVIFRYCFEHDCPYEKALQLQEWYEKLPVSPQHKADMGENRPAPQTFAAEKELLAWLQYLRRGSAKQQSRERALQYFLQLYDSALEIVASVYQRDEEEDGGSRVWTKDDISAGDLEKFICSGIPVNRSGNLQKVSSSVLSRHFRQYRMSRQRLDALKKGIQEVERFDLITLLFFLNSMPEDDEFPNHRCTRYIEEANRMLRDCGMSELYPVNAYEAFVLMCLLTEYPLEAYSSVWEKSYENAQEDL